MKIFKETIEYSPYCSKIFDLYYKDCKIGFFDIETTGLSFQKNCIILAGLAIPEGSCLNVIQLLAEDPSEEPELLNELLNELNKLDMVVTYNGKSFDMPFVKSRCQKHKVHISKELPFNLDLMRAVKYHSPLKAMLPNLKQKTVEAFLGLWESRTDEISGKDSVDLYYIYASEHNSRIRDIILLHNRDDIVQLSKLMTVLDRCNLHSFAFREGFPCGSLVIDKIEMRRKSLILEGYQRDNICDAQYYETPEIIFDSSVRQVTIKVPLVPADDIVVFDTELLSISFPEAIEGYLLLANGREVIYENAASLSHSLALNAASLSKDFY